MFTAIMNPQVFKCFVFNGSQESFDELDKEFTNFDFKWLDEKGRIEAIETPMDSVNDGQKKIISRTDVIVKNIENGDTFFFKKEVFLKNFKEIVNKEENKLKEEELSINDPS